MSVTLLLENDVQIPMGIRNLDDFRRWTRSEDFPERGRIDFIDGQIEVDMAADNLFFHSSPKTEIGGVLHRIVKRDQLGHLFIDKSRVTCLEVDLSCEPDIVFVSFDAVQSGRVQLAPTSAAEPDSFLEIEGPPDLIVEIVSDSSVVKDTERLFRKYEEAGVGEYWLVDARRDDLDLSMFVRGEGGFEEAPPTPDGFRKSRLLGSRFRFERERGPDGNWVYDLVEAD